MRTRVRTMVETQMNLWRTYILDDPWRTDLEDLSRSTLSLATDSFCSTVIAGASVGRGGGADWMICCLGWGHTRWSG